MDIPCIYSEKGCKWVGARSTMPAHIRECATRYSILEDQRRIARRTAVTWVGRVARRIRGSRGLMNDKSNLVQTHSVIDDMDWDWERKDQRRYERKFSDQITFSKVIWSGDLDQKERFLTMFGGAYLTESQSLLFRTMSPWLNPTFTERIDGAAAADHGGRVGVRPDDPGLENDVWQRLLQWLQRDPGHHRHEQLRVHSQHPEDESRGTQVKSNPFWQNSLRLLVN